MIKATQFPALSELVTQEMIDAYAELSGDYNPLHVDPLMAAASEFGSTIAHGPISLQVVFQSIAAGLGVDAMPPGSRIAVTFRAPVRVGDRVTMSIEELTEHEHGVDLNVVCHNQHSAVVVATTVYLPR